jgi:uncharacterized protein (DUF849 family)
MSMNLKAAINGKCTLEEHPAVPLTPREQAHQAALAPGAIHVHPRAMRMVAKASRLTKWPLR